MPAPEISTTKTNAAAASSDTNYSRPLIIVTTLFFMWGFLTSLNDILVPHLKSIFDLSYTRLMLVQFAFFSAYFLFSLPWSRVVNTIGYQRTMVAGLLLMAAGAFLFHTRRASGLARASYRKCSVL
jgi:FHS family L-fucose permease-like MFS transporter